MAGQGGTTVKNFYCFYWLINFYCFYLLITFSVLPPQLKTFTAFSSLKLLLTVSPRDRPLSLAGARARPAAPAGAQHAGRAAAQLPGPVRRRLPRGARHAAVHQHKVRPAPSRHTPCSCLDGWRAARAMCASPRRDFNGMVSTCSARTPATQPLAPGRPRTTGSP